ncbi:coupling protein TraD [Mariprofundus micogutta]|uniref:Coupling protein TraD n=2 Tax=Mariprofundus micogutta TaxID=1921010 RepID=A0A1L8CK72_9PROT|nr:coupling protein TraD [Mariprofundus micogutta]
MSNQSTGAQRTGNTAYRDPTSYIVGGALGACAFALVLYFPFFYLLESKWHELVSVPYQQPFELFVGWELLSELLAQPADFFKTAFANEPYIIADIFVRLTVPVLVSFSATWLILRNDIRPRKTEIIERGEAVESNEKSFEQNAQAKLKQADGIRIHADVRIPFSRESEHILIAGATGAGKSQALTHIIESVRERKDRSIIFDIKGDYTAQLANPDARNSTYLVAPWDERSIKWDIAADITDEIAAQSFAEAFIPRSGNESNPYFTEAAQDVLAGCIEYLCSTKPQAWSWRDLNTLLSSADRISAALESIEHAASQHIQLKQDGSVSPQTQGVMGSLRAPLKSLDAIAKYWDTAGGTSIVNAFMRDGAKGTLILAARPDMQSVATPLIAGLLALLMQKGLSLSDSEERRIFFICDELGALPKISKLVDLITLGRSKGLCLVAGIQDLGRLYAKYGRDETTSVASQFGTHIIGRLGDSDTAKWAADLFGQQRTERLQVNESQQNAVVGFGYQPSVNTTWQQSDKAALIDSDFLHLPKATAKGFYMWCRLTDDNGYALLGKLHYPINRVPTPFPPCIQKGTKPLSPAERARAARDEAIKSNPAKAPEASIKKAKEAQERVKVRRKKLGIETNEELLQAVVDLQEQPEPEQEQEQQEIEADGIETQIGTQALDLIVPGLDTAIEISEAIGGEVINEGAGQQQQSEKKRKRKFRLRSDSEIDGGM